MLPRKIELDPRRWGWNIEIGVSGFWIKTRGPFVWWGKSKLTPEQRTALIAEIREEDSELLERLAQT